MLSIAPHRPGHIFRLPPGVTTINDPDWHYHLLVRECDRDGVATLVWGSSKETEAVHGASYAVVKPQRLGINANHLRVPTYFYASILVLCDEGELEKRTGKALNYLHEVRKALKHAVGIGAGFPPPDIPGSRRGQIVGVRPTPFVEDLGGFRHALVVTQHPYSEVGRYQTIVPIVPGGVGVEVGQHVVRAAGEPWVNTIAGNLAEALLLIPATQTLWQADAIDPSFAPQQVDQHTLARVEEELCAFFRLNEV